MGDYSFNNGKFSVVVSNIKSSVYDVVSAISVKLFELGDSGNSKLREQLELELKELIEVSNTVTSKISKIDKMINLEEIDESSLIDVDSSKNDGIDNIKLSWVGFLVLGIAVKFINKKNRIKIDDINSKRFLRCIFTFYHKIV